MIRELRERVRRWWRLRQYPPMQYIPEVLSISRCPMCNSPATFCRFLPKGNEHILIPQEYGALDPDFMLQQSPKGVAVKNQLWHQCHDCHYCWSTMTRDEAAAEDMKRMTDAWNAYHGRSNG